MCSGEPPATDDHDQIPTVSPGLVPLLTHAWLPPPEMDVRLVDIPDVTVVIELQARLQTFRKCFANVSSCFPTFFGNWQVSDVPLTSRFIIPFIRFEDQNEIFYAFVFIVL